MKLHCRGPPYLLRGPKGFQTDVSYRQSKTGQDMPEVCLLTPSPPPLSRRYNLLYCAEPEDEGKTERIRPGTPAGHIRISRQMRRVEYVGRTKRGGKRY